MKSAEKAFEYIHKFATAQHSDYETTEKNALTREYIKYLESECEVEDNNGSKQG